MDLPWIYHGFSMDLPPEMYDGKNIKGSFESFGIMMTHQWIQKYPMFRKCAIGIFWIMCLDLALIAELKPKSKLGTSVPKTGWLTS